ncbi:MAG: acyl-CoA dehydrogenase family protein [Steroidobacteraceae bacterium]
MNLDYSDGDKELKSELRRFLQKACPPTRVRKVLDGDSREPRRLTSELAEMGWLAAAMPERFGGQELSYVALCGIAEELGRALAPTSYGSSVFLTAEALLLAGSEVQQRTYLPALASGQKIGTFALVEGRGPIRPEHVSCTWRGGKLTGEKLAVADGLDADVAIVSAQSNSNVQLFLVDLDVPAVTRASQKSVDPTRLVAKLTFRDAPAEPLGNGADWSVLQRVLDRAAVLFAFEQLGGADMALEMARDYALSRYAFGRPIGSFQAIKHKLADVYIANELARSNAYYAAWALAKNAPELPLAAATARVAACEAFERAARENMQVHGGVSATWAHDCHLYYRRARHLGSCIGTVNQWRDQAARLLIAQCAA